MALTPEHAIDVVNGVFGRHPGYRALHAKGTLCNGTFTALPEASTLTRAAHMKGEPVAVNVHVHASRLAKRDARPLQALDQRFADRGHRRQHARAVRQARAIEGEA